MRRRNSIYDLVIVNLCYINECIMWRVGYVLLSENELLKLHCVDQMFVVSIWNLFPRIEVVCWKSRN